jgi:hypothetical protein
VLDQCRVQVEPAEVGHPARADHREPGPAGVVDPLVADHRDVQGAAAEVEDREGRTDRHRPAQHVGEVAGGGDRLGHQQGAAGSGPERGIGAGHRGPTGPTDGRGQGLTAAGAPGRRVAEHRWRQEADRLDRGVGHRRQHGGEQIHRRDLPVAEEYGRLVDPSLRVRLVTGRIGLGQPLGVPADVRSAGGVQEHPGRQDRLPVEEQRPGPPVRPAQHRHGV